MSEKKEKPAKVKRTHDVNKPVSMWGYFGYQVLFSLPVIGLVALVLISIYAKNINVRNYACSFYCTLILTIALLVLVLVLGGWSMMVDALRSALAVWTSGL